jgi:protocatechuate 3,4-dioxygenase beta subunit
VVNLATGEPIRKVELTLSPMSSTPSGRGVSYNASTDAQGKFSIENVEPGTYTLSAQKTGFLQARYGARGPMQMGTPLTVSAGQVQKDLLFKLTPQGAISGRVFDDEGEPLQYAMVQVMTERFYRGSRQMMPSGGISTNDRGEYRLANLAPGKYILMATPPNRTNPMAPPAKPPDGQPETGLVPVYFPGAADVSQAAKIDLAPGAELTGHDLRLRRERVVRVKGKVVDGATGTPVKDVMVSVMPRANVTFNRMGTPVRGDDGEFEIANVAAGSYNLYVNSMRGDERSTGMQPLDVGDQNIEGVVVRLNPPQSVSGSITVEGDQKLSLSSIRVSLTPSQQGAVLGIGGPPSGTVQDDGTFVLKNTSPGKYSVILYGPTVGFYVKSVKVAGQELSGRELDWSGGVGAGPIQITVSTKGAQLAGRVEKDGGAAPGAMVVLVPEESRRTKGWLYKVGASDQTGAFSIKGIPPGEYKAFAWESVDFGAYEDPEFLKPFESKGVKIKLAEGDSQSVQIKVIPPE